MLLSVLVVCWVRDRVVEVVKVVSEALGSFAVWTVQVTGLCDGFFSLRFPPFAYTFSLWVTGTAFIVSFLLVCIWDGI